MAQPQMEEVPELEEQQPLLGSRQNSSREPDHEPDLESGFGNFDADESPDKEEHESWRKTCGEFLESKRWHRVVITLVSCIRR